MKKIYSLIFLLLVTAVIISGCDNASAVGVTGAEPPASIMEVHFMDVGQGDAALIKSGDHAMLIDAGDNSKGTLVQNYLQKQGITKLDYLILTHPDADHIGGADVIVTKFDIDTIFMSDYKKDNRIYDNLIQSMKYKNYQYTTPAAGSIYRFGDADIIILAPNRSYRDPNNASIVLMIQYGDNRFLFTGDAEAEAENDILANGLSIRADVYKAGHHGSRSSTSEDFFYAISPTYAVISCEAGNSYGHPHAQTLNTFRLNGVKVYRTDEDGTIIAISDGTNITFDVPASVSWQAGEPAGSSGGGITYVLNAKSRIFHILSCSNLPTTNRADSTDSREKLMAEGYEPCGRCNP